MLKWHYLILFSLLSINCLSQNRQFELWNKNQISIEPWEKISIDVSEKLHFSPQRSTITLRYADISIGYQAFRWLEYGAGFRISSVKREAGDWLQENRPMVFANFGKDLGHYEFDFYNRFEYRTYKGIKNYFRYRQSLRMKFPALTNWGMQFYLQEESFTKLNGDGTHLVRFYSGVTAFENNFAEIKIYYALQKQDIQSHWASTDILGVNLSFDI